MNRTETLTIYGYLCRGAYSRQYLADSLALIVRRCGLTAVGEPLVWGYPLDGRGGVGETILLPFGEPPVKLGWFRRFLLRTFLSRFRWAFLLFQPFTESFAVIDTYPDRRGPDGAPEPRVVVVIGSCVPLPRRLLDAVIRRRFGPVLKKAVIAL